MSILNGISISDRYSNSPLASVIAESIKNKREELEALDKEGLLYMLRCQTGIGKTYEAVNLMVDTLITDAKEENRLINKLWSVPQGFIKSLCASDNSSSSHEDLKKCTDILSKVLEGVKLTRLTDKKEITACFDEFVKQLISSGVTTIDDEIVKKWQSELDAVLDDYRAFCEKIINKPIIFITNTIDNVNEAFEDTRKRIDNHKGITGLGVEIDQKRHHGKTPEEARKIAQDRVQNVKSYLKKQCIRVPGNSDIIDDVASHTLGGIICDEIEKSALVALFKQYVPQDKEATDLWDRFKYKQKSHANSRYIPEFEKNEFHQIKSRLYSVVAFNIKAAMKDGEVRKSDRLAITRLMPATRITSGDARVVFMTTKKYFTSLVSFPKNIRIQNDYKKHMLIIDEVDKQHGVISKELLQDKAYPLLQSLKTCMPAGETNKPEDTTAFNDVKSIMEKGISSVRNVFADWELSAPFDYKNSENREPVQLFSSLGHTSCLAVADSQIKKNDAWVRLVKSTETSAAKNVLATVEKDDKSESKPNGFPHVLNSCASAYKNFLASVFYAAMKVYENERSDEKTKQIASFDRGLSAIISQYNLHALKKDIETFISTNSISLPGKANSEGNVSSAMPDFNFHKRGFQYNRVTREDASAHNVEFLLYSMPMSSTGFLMRLVENGAEVIGISATADAGTVVHNFDFQELRERLGAQFVVTTREQAEEIYSYYASKRRYEECGVSVHTEYLYGDEDYLHKWLSLPEISIRSAFNIPKQSNASYRVEEISKFVQAIERFAVSEDNRYMLCMLTRGVGKLKEEKEFLDAIFDQMRVKYGKKITPYYNFNAASMKKKKMDEIRSQLSNTDDKVIVFSAYESMGAGKNPDYKVVCLEDIKKLIFVGGSGDNPEGRQTDVDTVYLGLLTNMFTTADHEAESISSYKLSALYNIMCMTSSSILDPKTSKEWVKKALEAHPTDSSKFFNSVYKVKYINDRDSWRGNKSNADYIQAVRRYVEQAVGRMARTPLKRKEILIFSDSKMIDILEGDERPKELMSHEYHDMVKAAKAASNGTAKHPTEEDLIKNKALGINKKSWYSINTILKDLNNQSRHLKYSDAHELELFKSLISQRFEGYFNLKEFLISYRDKLRSEGVNLGLDAVMWDKISKIISTCERHNRPVNEVCEKLAESLGKKRHKLLEQTDRPVKQWTALRKQLLMHPTVDEIPEGFEAFYVELPEAAEGYKYNGIPEVSHLDRYTIFSEIRGVTSHVSSEAAELNKVVENNVVADHFKDNGFALQWKTTKYIISPVVFSNIYKPAVAEQAAEAVLVRYGFKFSELTGVLFEVFDGVIEAGDRAVIDFKTFSQSQDAKSNFSKKLNSVSSNTHIEKVIFLNLFNKTSSVPTFLTSERKPVDYERGETAAVLDIPGILDYESASVLDKHLVVISKFLAT